MEQPHKTHHRAIDDEKSLRQLKGLDGDAIAEDDERIHDEPHKEMFKADAAKNPANKEFVKDDEA